MLCIQHPIMILKYKALNFLIYNFFQLFNDDQPTYGLSINQNRDDLNSPPIG